MQSATTQSGTKVFLFLQGAPNTFARNLAAELQRRGQRVLRINLCVGDWLYWLGLPAVAYRGRLRDWEGFLRDFVVRHGVTDIIYYADRFPYHRVAIRVADELGLRTTSYEFGYLRPDWITLERRGMSAQSHFPDDPGQIRRIAARAPDPDLNPRYRFRFFDEAFNEVVFNLANFFLFFVYPFYQPDKMYNRLLEYLSYIPRLLRRPHNARRAEGLIEHIIDTARPCFVLALQMQNDYQIRANSPYRHLAQAIDETLRSFARHAPADCELVVKVHPLDNGLEDWEGIVSGIAGDAGIAERVHLIDGGNLMRLLGHARGVVVINSTVGLHALQEGCPCKVLGIATYDIAGLTHQGSLDAFWTAPTQPDRELCDALVRAMAATIQVKGNFFTAQGQAVAIPEVAERLVRERVNQPDAFVDPPPRLARAAARGIPHVCNDGAGGSGTAYVTTRQ